MGGGTIHVGPFGVNHRPVGDGVRCRWMRAQILVVALIAGCGGHPPPPKRGVVESDIGSSKFRRFQPGLDVEVWVDGNKAEVLTASYVTESAEKKGKVEVKGIVNVFVA